MERACNYHLHSYIHLRNKHQYFQTSMNNLIYVIISTCTINAKRADTVSQIKMRPFKGREHTDEKGDVL